MPRTNGEQILTPAGTPVWVNGDGPPIVLVHGVLMDHRMWQAQVDALSARYRVCCLDMLGHGASPNPVGERSLDDFVAQVHEVVTHLGDGIPPVLGGFSMGGLVAQAYAIRYHAELRGLIIMNAVYDRSATESATVRERFAAMERGGADAAIESALVRWFTDADRLAHAERVDAIVDWMAAGDFSAKLKAHRVFATADPQTAGRLGVISCPTLVMTGDGDSGSPPHMSRNMADSIDRAQLHILDGQQHMMPVLDADRVNAILLRFLDQLSVS